MSRDNAFKKNRKSKQLAGWFFAVIALNFALTPIGCYASQQELEPTKPESPNYGYYYKGKLISLTPSKRLIAIGETGKAFTSFVKTQGLERHPLSVREPLMERKLGLYRLPTPARKTDKRIDLSVQIEEFVRTTGEEIQPVFEQGQVLLIPINEVIVGFKAVTSLKQARAYFAPYRKTLGIDKVRKHRKNSYIVTIENPSNGRSYQVSRFLAGLDGLRFAEPNHIMLQLYEPNIPTPAVDAPKKEPSERKKDSQSKRSTELPLRITYHNSVAWEVLVDEGFEAAALPANWKTGSLSAVTDAYWDVTNVRSHAGNRSCYATDDGTDGVASPGPYPNDSYSWLDTPSLDLAAYEEVYIELWFYAQYENPNVCNVYDYGRVAIYDPSSGNINWLSYLAVCHFGDLTVDPTADNGWRRALIRVPPDLRLNGVNVRFVFISDNNTTDEGLYIDQIRIVGTRDVDTDPVGTNDTYGARHYGMMNAGQIAGLGNENNDMNVPVAWDLVSVSNNVVVAVIDQGLDLSHPDLNLVTGYDYNGTGDGHARGDHGTACAGCAGAVGDNSLGVLGTAPGVNIMPVYKGGTWDRNAQAIDTAVDKGADILTNSWGQVRAPVQTVEDAITDALNAGRVVLFAAGNGPDRNPWTYDVAFPGNLTGTTDLICVGASSPTDEHKAAASSDGSFWWGSSYVGDGPDIVAPSPWCYTTDIQGADGYNPSGAYSLIDPTDQRSEDYTPTFGGTSCATPKVAGIVALMLSSNPYLTPHQVKQILRETADDIDVPGIDDKTGAGRVNAEEAVKSALALRLRRSFLPLYFVPSIP